MRRKIQIIIGLLAWEACGILSAGFDYSYWQHDYARNGLKPECGSAIPSIAMGMFGGAEFLALGYINGMTQDGWELKCHGEDTQP